MAPLQHLLLRHEAKRCCAGPWALPPPSQLSLHCWSWHGAAGISIPLLQALLCPVSPFRLRKCSSLWQGAERKGTDTS